jgi:hypothetical protein
MKWLQVKVMDRDKELLEFLWKWKVATTATLVTRFYGKSLPTSGYKRLCRLQRGGFIKWKPDPRTIKFVWTLTQKGFDVVRDSLELPLKEDGFDSENINHDLITSAVHLGDWLLGEPERVILFSEQQLRRFKPEYLPLWVPDVTTHRPDGYWCLPNGIVSRLISLDVEISLKPNDAYGKVSRFYNRQENLHGILWVVKRPWIAKHIHKLMTERESDKPANHNFIYLNEFVEDGWRAKIKIGNEAGKSIEEFLMHTPLPTSGQCRPMRPATVALNTMKRPRDSQRYAV